MEPIQVALYVMLLAATAVAAVLAFHEVRGDLRRRRRWRRERERWEGGR